jgi:hypothetical protein
MRWLQTAQRCKLGLLRMLALQQRLALKWLGKMHWAQSMSLTRS